MNKLSQKLKEKRGNKPLRVIAEEVGISHNQIWRYEKGIAVKEMSFKHARLLSEFLGVDMESIYQMAWSKSA